MLLRLPTSVYLLLSLANTFFDYAGIGVPWRMHGDNLRPLLENPSEDWNRPLTQENFSRSYCAQTNRGANLRDPFKGLPNQNVDWWLFVRYGEYKYIQTLVLNEIEELYNIDEDLRELVNPTLEPAYCATLVSMRAKMMSELKRMDAGFIDNLPEPNRF